MSIEEIFGSFTPVTAAKAKEAILNQDKAVLFIGRVSCPYCQLFVPKLASVAQTLKQEVLYLNSEDFQDLDAIQELRAEFGVPTVPGLLVSNAGQVKVVCDSSQSEEAIANFIQA